MNSPTCNIQATSKQQVQHIPTDAEKTIRRIDYISRFGVFLLKGGLNELDLEKHLSFYACGRWNMYMYDENSLKSDVHLAIDKALLRWFEPSKKGFASLVQEWVVQQDGIFNTQKGYNELQLTTSPQKKHFRTELSRLVSREVIEKYGTQSGVYRKVDNNAPIVDIFSADTKSLNIEFPLSLHEYFRPMAKNIVVIAGTQDVGKSAFMLNLAKMNVNRGMPIRYCTSEMGAAELRSRIDMFEDTPLEDWRNVDFRERATNFQDLILPDGLNIIDYLEITDSFFLVAGLLTEIYNKLRGGIAVVALQKDHKTDLGRGGSFSLEKPRLYLSLTSNPPEGNIAKIVKCKNWADRKINPNGRECVFNVFDGCQIRQNTSWKRWDKT